VAEFGRFRDCLSERDRDEDDLVETGKVQKKRVGVIKFCVYERCGDIVRLVRSVPHTAEVTD